MNLTTTKTVRKGRTHIRIRATPKTAGARALLRQFHGTVKQFEKKWKAMAKARAKARKAKR